MPSNTHGTIDEYFPRRHDSHLASVGPETSFLDFFKQSLIYTSNYCTDPNCCTFFCNDDRTSNPSTVQVPAGPEISYPLGLFEDLQGLPPHDELNNLAAEFHNKFVPVAPFLSRLSCLSPDKTDIPLYLLLSKALLGTLTSNSNDVQRATATLWRSCAALVTAAVEIDNSLGRAMPWLTAVSFLLNG